MSTKWQHKKQDSMDEVVSHCPIAGHGPICSKRQCQAEFQKDAYESCKKELSKGIVRVHGN